MNDIKIPELNNTFFRILQKQIGCSENFNLTENGFETPMNLSSKNQLYSNPITMLVYFYLNKCAIHITSEINQRYITEYEKKNEKENKRTCYTKDIVILSKYEYLYRLLKNRFITKEQKSSMTELFCKTQRIYFTFQRLLRNWKIKRTPINVNTDLYMNPIELETPNSMIIYQNGAGYMFLLTDIMKILNSALLNSYHFFSDPVEPKNPYTNIPFTYSIMHSIYHKIRLSNFKMPILLQLFYYSNFDINQFTYENEAILRECYINDCLKRADPETMCDHIDRMFDQFKMTNKIEIHDEFPKDILIKTMLPYLKLYLVHAYSISNTDKKYDSYCVLKAKLRAFAKYNPHFGKKITIKVDLYDGHYNPFMFQSPYAKPGGFITKFNTKHLHFNELHCEKGDSDSDSDSDSDTGTDDDDSDTDSFS